MIRLERRLPRSTDGVVSAAQLIYNIYIYYYYAEAANTCFVAVYSVLISLSTSNFVSAPKLYKSPTVSTQRSTNPKQRKSCGWVIARRGGVAADGGTAAARICNESLECQKHCDYHSLEYDDESGLVWLHVAL